MRAAPAYKELALLDLKGEINLNKNKTNPSFKPRRPYKILDAKYITSVLEKNNLSP